MFSRTLSVSKAKFLHFCRDRDGSLAPVFALMLTPMLIAVGASVDYSRANSVKSTLQATLDAAVLAGAKAGVTSGGSDWSQLAQNIFQSNLAVKTSMAATPTFTANNDGTYSGSVTGSVPTSLLGIINIHSVNVTANATATATAPDDSCILTLDHGQPATHVSLTLNGAPIINLTGCSIRTNSSLDCNGHDGSVTKGIAGGTATDCGSPYSHASMVPDIYKDLAKIITPQCGSTKLGVSWTPGVLPTGAGVKTVSVGSYTEYHICGDLNLSGTGYLTGTAPMSDTVIVIENGSLNLADNASINTLKTAIVMTGDNTVGSSVNFPNGNGHTATLSLSPPTDSTNPWQGVALYQDPKLTYNVNNTWGPGANFNADGLVYLGNSNVVTDGDTASSNAKCTKFVMNQFTTNGHVDLNFTQSASTCAAIGLKQWGGSIVHLTQ
jgi:Flp pilus assembly protein TadG